MSLTKERQERKPHVKLHALYHPAYINYEADRRHLLRPVQWFLLEEVVPGRRLLLFFFFPGQVLALGPLLHQASALALTFIPSLGWCPVILVFRRAIHEPPGCHHSSNCLLGARTENQQSGLKQELVQLRSQLLSESEAYLDYTAACLKAQAKIFLLK